MDEAISLVESLKRDLQNRKTKALRRICERLSALIQAYSANQVADDIYRVNRVGKKYSYIPATKLSKAFSCVYQVDNDKGIITVDGGKDTVFIEFGAGYGADGSNPLKADISFSVARGSYGKGNGKKDKWFFKDGGETIMAKGTPASKPIYLAIEQVKKEVPQILSEVFG